MVVLWSVIIIGIVVVFVRVRICASILAGMTRPMTRSWEAVSAVVVLGSMTGISIARNIIGIGDRNTGHSGKPELREAYGVKICLRR